MVFDRNGHALAKNDGMDFEEIWRMREEEIYPDLFGPTCRGIFPLEWELFQKFGATQVNPLCFHHGVLEFAPTQDRTSWIYVTSGHSNSYDETESGNGEGVEFVLEVTEPGD